jgi:hypothetical protein|tara:strand:- start:327 stop:548 length:222 start_codon:yes stop_codon:yes gene_type:complete
MEQTKQTKQAREYFRETFKRLKRTIPWFDSYSRFFTAKEFTENNFGKDFVNKNWLDIKLGFIIDQNNLTAKFK